MIGVYFLKQGKEIVYVGQSVNIERRTEEHWVDKSKSFDNVEVFPCDKEVLNSTEASFILRHNPIYNKMKYEKTIGKKNNKVNNGKQINASQAVYDKLSDLSRELDMPRTQVINMLINEYLKGK